MPWEEYRPRWGTRSSNSLAAVKSYITWYRNTLI
jgi:hypothetical protein